MNKKLPPLSPSHSKPPARGAEHRLSRRHFLGVSAAGLGAGVCFAAPARAAAEAAGFKPSDLPGLKIKEVKAYVLARGSLASVVTESGIEGNCALQNQIWHANWDHRGWLEYARAALTGKNALDLPQFTSQWTPVKRRFGQDPYAAAMDICLWDIVGKAVGLPIYQMLGAYKDRVLAYASSQHLETTSPDPYVQAVRMAKAEGFLAFKINPPPPAADGDSHFLLDIEVCRAVRRAAGAGYQLIYGAAGNHGRREAMAVGRVLDELGFTAYHDPLPTTDIEGWAELRRALTVPLVAGEFLFSIYDYAEYIRREAADVLRFVVDNVGGITAGLKVARLAECCGMECSPHGVGAEMYQAAHLHCALAMPNSAFIEVPWPQGARDQQTYLKDRIRIAADGHVHAPRLPGLGYEIDRDALDKLTQRVER
jgi:L-alanine-DL-glutamate epimerase-like enolase superfamily enzyme